jgi:alkanesulfonate monooxygenase SsuD/methylene tetrahydromethanopterin reductase-like flavin-dependent oxidoreductase (luciferase family)
MRRDDVVEFENEWRHPSTQSTESDRPGGLVKAINHNGKYYRAMEAVMAKPLQDIPITIAAKGTKMMQIAAKYADIWELSYLTPSEFSSKNDKFSKIMKLGNNTESEPKRNSSLPPKRSIELDVIVAESNRELEVKKKTLAAERGPLEYEQVLQKGLVGTPDEIHTKVSKYIDLGIDQFFLAFQNPSDLISIELFMKSVDMV